MSQNCILTRKPRRTRPSRSVFFSEEWRWELNLFSSSQLIYYDHVTDYFQTRWCWETWYVGNVRDLQSGWKITFRRSQPVPQPCRLCQAHGIWQTNGFHLLRGQREAAEEISSVSRIEIKPVQLKLHFRHFIFSYISYISWILRNFTIVFIAVEQNHLEPQWAPNKVSQVTNPEIFKQTWMPVTRLFCNMFLSMATVVITCKRAAVSRHSTRAVKTKLQRMRKTPCTERKTRVWNYIKSWSTSQGQLGAHIPVQLIS